MRDLKAFYDLSVEAARRAGEIQREGFGRRVEIRYKGVKDIVTEVDHRCEEEIYSIINKRYPDHAFLAEEEGLRSSDSPYRWIVDPLDGTTNYTHKYPFFCVSIALEEEGEVCVGVVYDPLRDELFGAIKGEGASMNGASIHASSIGEVEKALLVTGRLTKGTEALDLQFAQLRRIALKAQAVRGDGSAALDLCYVAIGRFEGFWEYGLNPWDTAAGSLIVKEAGGHVTSFSGSPFDIYGKETLASNGLIHKALIDTLTPAIRNKRGT